MPRRGSAGVRVYDVRGSLVRELARGEFAAGQHRLTWDGRSGAGAPVGPGIYFVQVRSSLGSAKLRLVMLE
jgi:flagellar hook assembly protein FlgD